MTVNSFFTKLVTKYDFEYWNQMEDFESEYCISSLLFIIQQEGFVSLKNGYANGGKIVGLILCMCWESNENAYICRSMSDISMGNEEINYVMK